MLKLSGSELAFTDFISLVQFICEFWHLSDNCIKYFAELRFWFNFYSEGEFHVKKKY